MHSVSVIWWRNILAVDFLLWMKSLNEWPLIHLFFVFRIHNLCICKNLFRILLPVEKLRKHREIERFTKSSGTCNKSDSVMLICKIFDQHGLINDMIVHLFGWTIIKKRIIHMPRTLRNHIHDRWYLSFLNELFHPDYRFHNAMFLPVELLRWDQFHKHDVHTWLHAQFFHPVKQIHMSVYDHTFQYERHDHLCDDCFLHDEQERYYYCYPLLFQMSCSLQIQAYQQYIYACNVFSYDVFLHICFHYKP